MSRKGGGLRSKKAGGSCGVGEEARPRYRMGVHAPLKNARMRKAKRVSPDRTGRGDLKSQREPMSRRGRGRRRNQTGGRRQRGEGEVRKGGGSTTDKAIWGMENCSPSQKGKDSQR